MRVQAEQLQKIVKRASKYLSKVEYMPLVLKRLHFDGGTVKAYGQDQGIEYHTGQDYGRFIQADLLKSALPKSGSIDLAVDLSKGQISISSDTANQRFKLVSPVEYEFPGLPKTHQDVPADFMNGVLKVIFAMTENWTRGRIRCVFVKDNVFYATDNLRIARFKSKIDHKGVAYIPGTLLNIIVKDSRGRLYGYAEEENLFWMFFKDDAPAPKPVKVKATKSFMASNLSNLSPAKRAWITKRAKQGQEAVANPVGEVKEESSKEANDKDDWACFAKAVKDPYPTERFDQAIDSFLEDLPFCEFDQVRLAEIVKQAKPFAYGPMKQIIIKVDKAKMIVEAINDAGSFVEEIDVRYDGASMSFSVSHPLFLSCVERANKFAYNPETHHMLFKADGLEVLLLCQKPEDYRKDERR